MAGHRASMWESQRGSSTTICEGAEMKRSKAYLKAAEQIDFDSLYSPLAAVRIAKGSVTTKFDPTVEVSMRLGVDPRKADR